MRCVPSRPAPTATSPRTAPPPNCWPAVRKVLQGGAYVTTSLAERVVQQLNGSVEVPRHAKLSNRELEVLRRIVAGQRSTDIAQALNLSVKTISTHKTRIMDKLQLDSTAALIRYGMEHRLHGEEPPAGWDGEPADEPGQHPPGHAQLNTGAPATAAMPPRRPAAPDPASASTQWRRPWRGAERHAQPAQLHRHRDAVPDNELNVRRFTEKARKIIALRDRDIGRPPSDLTSQLEYPDLQADVQEMLRTRVASERQISRDGRWSRRARDALPHAGRLQFGRGDHLREHQPSLPLVQMLGPATLRAVSPPSRGADKSAVSRGATRPARIRPLAIPNDCRRISRHNAQDAPPHRPEAASRCRLSR